MTASHLVQSSWEAKDLPEQWTREMASETLSATQAVQAFGRRLSFTMLHDRRPFSDRTQS